MTIDGVEVKGVDSYDLARRYVAEAKARVPDVSSITVTEDGDDAKVAWTAHHTKFERIRRLTGYLVGTLDRWNDAKRAEEHDRVKHS